LDAKRTKFAGGKKGPHGGEDASVRANRAARGESKKTQTGKDLIKGGRQLGRSGEDRTKVVKTEALPHFQHTKGKSRQKTMHK